MMNELENILMNSERPSVSFGALRKSGDIGRLYPEAAVLIGVPQNAEHHLEGDVWTHTMMVLDEAAKRRDTVRYPFGFMLSALCHDFGKAVCTAVATDGKIHSYEHEIKGLPVVRAFLERLGADERLAEYVLNMTELHMEPNIMANAGSKLKKTNRLFDKAVEPFDLIQLAVCDSLGKLPPSSDTEDFLMQRYEKYRKIMARPHLTERDLLKEGTVSPADFPEILAYAHKLRLAGLDKDDQLRQSLAYARTLQKKKE